MADVLRKPLAWLPHAAAVEPRARKFWRGLVLGAPLWERAGALYHKTRDVVSKEYAADAGSQPQVTLVHQRYGTAALFAGSGSQQLAWSGRARFKLLGDLSLFLFITTGGVAGTDAWFTIEAGTAETQVNNACYELYGNGGLLRHFHEFNIGSNSDVSSGFTLSANTEYRLAVVRDAAATDYILWVNGIKRSTVGYTTQPTTTSAAPNLYLAGRAGALEPAHGHVHAAWVWNRQLTEREVLELMCDPWAPVRPNQFLGFDHVGSSLALARRRAAVMAMAG